MLSTRHTTTSLLTLSYLVIIKLVGCTMPPYPIYFILTSNPLIHLRSILITYTFCTTRNPLLPRSLTSFSPVFFLILINHGLVFYSKSLRVRNSNIQSNLNIAHSCIPTIIRQCRPNRVVCHISSTLGLPSYYSFIINWSLVRDPVTSH
jgi:hypothetical protein